MRIGLIGPGSDAPGELARALESLLADPAIDRIVYLGADHTIDGIEAARGQQRLAEVEFLARAADLACAGSADALTGLLTEERTNKRLHVVRRLPEPPARAIEMMDKWIVLVVHDKAVLDEDDIANAHIIVYGRSDEAGVKRFGPRCFFTPGPVSGQRVGCLELLPEGQIEVRLLDLEGNTVFRETLHGSGAKLVVSS